MSWKISGSSSVHEDDSNAIPGLRMELRQSRREESTAMHIFGAIHQIDDAVEAAGADWVIASITPNYYKTISLYHHLDLLYTRHS